MDPHDEDEHKHRHVDTHEVLWLVSRFLFMLYSTLPLPTLLKFDKKVTKMQILPHDTSVYEKWNYIPHYTQTEQVGFAHKKSVAVVFITAAIHSQVTLA